MVLAAADCDELHLRGRGYLAVVIITPADGRAVGAERTCVRPAAADCGERFAGGR